MQQILKKSTLSLREVFRLPKTVASNGVPGTILCGYCVCSFSLPFPRAHSFTAWIHWMPGTRKELAGVLWFSHLCLLSPPKRECIQNKLFWKHILSIQVLLQDLTIEGTSRILILGSSWMGLLKNPLSACSERKEVLGWKQVKALPSFGERRGQCQNCLLGGSTALLVSYREWCDSSPSLDKVAVNMGLQWLLIRCLTYTFLYLSQF